MDTYNYKPLIPPFINIMYLSCAVLCVLRIGTTSTVTMLAVIFIVALLIGLFMRALWLRKDVHRIDVYSRIRNCRKLLPLRVLRLVFMVCAAYLWLSPTVYTRDGFAHAMQVFENESFERTIQVLALVIPAPVKDGIQYSGNIVLQIYTVMDRIPAVREQMNSMPESDREEFLQEFKDSINFSANDIQGSLDSLQRRLKVLILCTVLDIILSKVISLMGIIQYRKYLKECACNA